MSEEKKQEIFLRLQNAIVEGDEAAAEQAAKDTLEAGIEPLATIKASATKAMDIVGDKWQRLEIFLGDVMLCADAMKACMRVLLPHLTAGQAEGVMFGKVVIGTVFGDIHDIGKNLVGTMLSVAGFDIIDLGTDVAPKKFIEKAEEVGAKMIGMSSLLTTSMPYQGDVIQYLVDMGLREKYYVIVGGGPVTPEYVRKIKADGYGKYADNAVRVAKRLVSEGVKPPLPEPIIDG